MSEDEMMVRVVMLDDPSSLEIAQWADGVGVPPCFSCGSTTQGVGQTTINIRHSAIRGTYAFLNTLCRVCDGQAQSNLTVAAMTKGESPVDTFHRAMGIDPSPPDPAKMS